MRTSAEQSRRALGALPNTFRYSQARQVLNDRQLRELHAAGLIERVSRGAYRKAVAEGGDVDLEEIAAKAAGATLCLRSALARHDLIDDLPVTYDIAVPRRTWRQPQGASDLAPVRSSNVRRGPDNVAAGSRADIGIYNPERCIIDAYRMRIWKGRSWPTRRCAGGCVAAASPPRCS